VSDNLSNTNMKSDRQNMENRIQMHPFNVLINKHIYPNILVVV
jgi:hypothetical protein